MKVFWWLFMLLALASLVYRFLLLPSRRVRPLKLGDVVQVKPMHPSDLNLPLGNLGIFVKPGGQMHVIFPALTSTDQVRYVDRWYDRRAVRRAASSNSFQRQKISLLAPVIEQQLELEPEVKRIEKYQQKLRELLRLASSSQSHTETSANLKRKLTKIADWLADTERLRLSTLTYIRDVLIANEIETSAPDLIAASPQLRAEYLSLRQTYRLLQDDAESDFPNELPQR